MTTTPTTAACPDPEQMGAFVEGRLSATERAEMTRHLDHCQPCRSEVAALAQYAAEGTTDRAMRSGWWLAAAASLVTIAGAAVYWRTTTVSHDRLPVASLVAAAKPLGYRSVEARLSGGFAWAELRGAVRSSTEASNAKQMKLTGAAGEVIDEAAKNPDAATQHAAAIASLLTDQTRSAIERLTKITAANPSDARAWSDLAAAYHTQAVRTGHASDEPLALAAADHALKIDPRLPEALFNRALIVEKLGLLFEARDAWTRYLDVDSKSEWAAEARARRDALPGTTDRSLFERSLPQFERDAAAGDARAVAQFVARFPQQTRATTEVLTLTRWSNAFRSGDTAEADRMLAIANSVAASLRARSGEELLTDIVAAIERATHAERERLAEGHVLYDAGRRALGERKAGVAREQLLHAADRLRGSAAALNARYFAAVAADQAGDTETAERELRELSDDAMMRSEYKALRAQIAWEHGLTQGKLARWPAAIEQYREAVALFDELGERSNSAFVNALLAEASSFLGRRDDAWQAWSASFRTMSEQGAADRISVWLNTASRTELIDGHPDSARSIVDLEVRNGPAEGRVRAEVLFRRALLSARAGDSVDALASLDEGRRVAERIDDVNVRSEAIADLEFAEGVTWAATNPMHALASLTQAVDQHRTDRRMLLPATLFERARVLRSLGRADDARVDLESAVEAVESQRKPVQWRDTTSGALEGIDEIYTTLAELLLERGNDRDAFVTADRAAAHAFYGASATGSLTSIDALQQRLAPGTVVLEYLILPRRTIIFFLDSGTFATRQTAVPAADVARTVTELDVALRERAAVARVQDASSRLEKILIAPVRDLLSRGSSITFVPDPLIASLPFAVLFDAASGQWLIEDHAVRIAPSALFKSDAPRDRGARVVVIRPSGGIDLPKTTNEVAAIVQLYPEATVIEGSSATAASVLESIGDANVIHYAGHTNNEGDAGLVLRADGERSEVLYGAEVALASLRGAPLVVLAGCRTLRGGARREDLTTSLARAFLLAGARAVVGTTWDVDDGAAAAFFTRFHQLNATTADPAGALSGAQRSMLHEKRHPADWAFPQIVVRAIDS